MVLVLLLYKLVIVNVKLSQFSLRKQRLPARSTSCENFQIRDLRQQRYGSVEECLEYHRRLHETDK